MTAATAPPCFSLFSEENKFSFQEINGGLALPVTAFILDPVVAVAVVDRHDVMVIRLGNRAAGHEIILDIDKDQWGHWLHLLLRVEGVTAACTCC